ncbi:unnamed protein product [Closterium sp. NIES-53]
MPRYNTAAPLLPRLPHLHSSLPLFCLAPRMPMCMPMFLRMAISMVMSMAMSMGMSMGMGMGMWVLRSGQSLPHLHVTVRHVLLHCPPARILHC